MERYNVSFVLHCKDVLWMGPNYRLIGQRPGNNVLIHQTIHITFNSNGEATASVDHTNSECK